jgi:hypothetical protein
LPKPVPSAEIRQGDTRVGGPGTESGSVVAVPYPEIGSQLLVCAPNHDGQTIEARGGAATPRVVALKPGTAGCPPLPTPPAAPAPSATIAPSATPSPAAPAPSPSPSPTASP